MLYAETPAEIWHSEDDRQDKAEVVALLRERAGATPEGTEATTTVTMLDLMK